MPLINDSLAYKGENVKIFDFELKDVLKEGKFQGIGEVGEALIETVDGQTEKVYDGRMRQWIIIITTILQY